jgi:hypothetical protein
MIGAATLLAWLSVHTEILFADGLRYIAQAQRIEAGAWRDGLVGSVDHPVYPLAIAATHGGIGVGGWKQTPESWQAAAQGASLIAGVLLVIPLYLVTMEVLGARSAWLGVVLFYMAPLTGHILADVLSEGTFLLAWTWGLYAALRFLRHGTFGWLPLTIAFSALAYLTRPEGLLLPLALVAALVVMPLLRSTRMNWPRWWAAVGFLVIGPALVVGPFVVSRGGGLATKPAIAKLLGLAPRAAADAVERAKPLEVGQSEWKTYELAAKTVWEAVRDITSAPLIPLALLGVVVALRSRGDRSRAWLLLGIIVGAAILALLRLHITGGYCTPRHAIVLAVLFIPAAAHGLDRLLGSVSIPGRLVGLGEGRFTAGPAIWALVLLGYFAWSGPQALEPVNKDFVGYRLAGEWVAREVPADAPVVDVTGWALYYGGRPGYTFATLRDAPNRPDLRYVVAREAHLKGVWWYCDLIRHLVGKREPVKVFPEHGAPGQAKVYVFDRAEPEVPSVSWLEVPARR